MEAWLEALREDLASITYRPSPVRRVMIPKPAGGERPLGIPTLRDRVAQTAAKLVLEPIFEADFEDCAYGYRPERSAGDAIKATHRLIRQGYADVVDADLSKYFDTIPHAELLKSVARRVVDAKVLRPRVKSPGVWLRAPVEERDGAGKRRMSGGQGQPERHAAWRRGQSAARQPLHEPIPEVLACEGVRQDVRAHVVNYADDFVIHSRGKADEALAWTRAIMTRLGSRSTRPRPR